MPLFGRNPNETAFTGGKKNWADVIKNSGPNGLLVWRQPEEDFNTNSTLIVMPGEEAVFIKGGIIEQTFDNGTYKLSTENYPFISRLRNAFTGGISTFNCVVYFIRVADSPEVFWGTSSPIQVMDRTLNMQVDFKGRGSYTVKVANAGVFLKKLLTTNIPFLTPDGLDDFFENQFGEVITTGIAEVLSEFSASGQPLIGVDSKRRGLSKEFAPELSEILESYGLELVNFNIRALDMDPEIKQRYNEASMGRIDKQFEAMGDKDRMDILGDDRWRLQQTTNILGDLANNPGGAGGVAAAGAGLGMGMGAGGAFSAMAQNMFAPMQPAASAGAAPGPSGRFATKSSESAPASSGNADDPVAKLKKLKEMLDLGLIEQSEFDVKKVEIMGRM